MMLFSVKRYLLNIIYQNQKLKNIWDFITKNLETIKGLSKKKKCNLFYKIIFFKYKPRQIKTTETRKGLILIKSNGYSLTKNQDGIRKENGRQNSKLDEKVMQTVKRTLTHY